MKKRLIAVAAPLLLIGLFVIWWTRPDEGKVVLSQRQTLNDNWAELRPPRPLTTVGPWSEVIVELPKGYHWEHLGKGFGLFSQDGKLVQIAGYLTTTDGLQVDLTPQFFERNEQVFAILSSPELERTKEKRQFRQLSLRSNPPVQILRAVWLSDDPSNYKDGTIENGLN